MSTKHVLRTLMWTLLCALAPMALPLSWAHAADGKATAADAKFTIAVIPDTQNYLDHRHQRAQGFAFDAADLFLEQMRYVAAHLPDRGGNIRFVTAVGDVWQSRVESRGISPARDADLGVMPKVAEIEAPTARRGYELIAGRVPFSVVPGNHDYDWAWTDGKGIRVGGLVNYNSVFGERSTFFKGQSWYVGAHDGGADSALVFSAAGYRFLHIGLQFEPSDESLAWARQVLKRYRGLPTIVTTHKHLESDASRPSGMWEKLIRDNDQVFMVLSGHFNAQAFRKDANRFGHDVYQIMSDYQNRHQTAKERGLDSDSSLPVGVLGVGDGWLRLMTFDFSDAMPSLRVRTYSTHYQRFSNELPEYIAWYKQQEKPQLSDAAFLSADDFSIDLADFRTRFDSGRR